MSENNIVKMYKDGVSSMAEDFIKWYLDEEDTTATEDWAYRIIRLAKAAKEEGRKWQLLSRIDFNQLNIQSMSHRGEYIV